MHRYVGKYVRICMAANVCVAGMFLVELDSFICKFCYIEKLALIGNSAMSSGQRVSQLHRCPPRV